MRWAVKFMLFLIRDKHKRYKVWKYAEKQISKYDFETSPYVRELQAPLKSMMFLYPREHFTDGYDLEFEGYLFKAHHYYKDYLENVYSGYMTPPPIEKRKPKTRAVYINLESNWNNYKGVYYCVHNE